MTLPPAPTEPLPPTPLVAAIYRVFYESAMQLRKAADKKQREVDALEQQILEAENRLTDKMVLHNIQLDLITTQRELIGSLQDDLARMEAVFNNADPRPRLGPQASGTQPSNLHLGAPVLPR
jgi:hypothetical protein